jgi:predicted transcriptional regulator
MLRLNSGAWGRILFGANKLLERVTLPDDERQALWKLLNKTHGDDDTCSPLAGLEAARDRLAGQTDKPKDQPTRAVDFLTDNERTILRALRNRWPGTMFVTDIAAETSIGEKTCGKIVVALIERGLAYRASERSGVTITPAGKELLKKAEAIHDNHGG